MKKIILSLAVVAMMASSCKKQEGTGDLPIPPESSNTLVVPSNFGKKMLFEELTGAWCGWCPRGAYYFDSVSTLYPNKCIGVAIHVGDVMEVPELAPGGVNVYDTMYANTGYPNGAIDRGILQDPSDWPSAIPSEIGLYAKCGFAIDATNISGHTLTLTVHTGFAADIFSDYRLSVFITETDVHNATNSAYDQHNYYSNSDQSILLYYYMPDPMVDFHHKNVLRKVVSSIPYGDPVPQKEMVKGHDYIKTYSVDLTGLNWSNCEVVTFLDKYSPVPTSDPAHPARQVQNVQKVKIGKFQSWN
ncbi:MAG: Omp28-related outer membrane protein [Bacteroidetes bacterium]|nr:Omp28-related outer membrane protein [Bacteroidota bacterium]